jgi:hypothetical protein
MSSLQESRNEWVSRLVNIMVPQVSVGLKSIYTEAFKLCVENDEEGKYLMTFQNFLSRIPKWNDEIISGEVKRIVDNSSCTYLEDLITCVHIIQLKALTCIRVGQKQKKIDINIPKLSNFVHRVYINVARRIYTNIYLFKHDITPLDVQKNNRELELIIQECIVNTIREGVPVDDILRAYLDESVEENVLVSEEIINEAIPNEVNTQPQTASVENVVNKEENPIILKKDDNLKIESDSNNISLDIKSFDSPQISTEPFSIADLNSQELVSSDVSQPVVKQPTNISFSNTDQAISVDKREETIIAPKNVERLEAISKERNEQRRLEELADFEDDGGDGKLTISAQPMALNPNSIESLDNIVLSDVTTLS